MENLKVKYPLKMKLLSLIIVMLLVSLGIFVFLALNLFKADKSAYIFEALLSKAETERTLLENKFRHMQRNLQVHDDQVYIGEELITSKLLEREDNIFQLKIFFIQQSQVFELIDRLIPANLEMSSVLGGITQDNIHQAVRKIELDGVTTLVSYSFQPDYQFAVVASISQKDAFSATDELIHKSLYFGVFILGTCLIIAVFLVTPLTRQLENLYQLILKIGQGDFTSRMTVKGSDEVSALSHSVNAMSDKILDLLEEVKEKARLEGEVAVAKLVQESFFPEPQFQDEKIDFFAHYLPASECSGDWWAIYHTPTHKIFFIADATGHGLPAALLTATMNSCKAFLDYTIEHDPEIVTRPEEILRFMNLAVSGSGNKIQVTCFVASIELTTNTMKYANASHPTPLLYPGVAESISKQDIVPLLCDNGPRLGQNVDSTYTSVTRPLNVGDSILMFTDGIIEALNSEGKQWGERRLFKAITENNKLPSQQILTLIMCQVEDFAGSCPQDDDYTALCVRVNS